MLLLTSTSDVIQLITGSAVTGIDVHASFVDYSSGTTVTPGRTNTPQITTATTTNIVAAPGASTQRNVKQISIRNSSGVSCAVTVKHYDGTTAIPLLQYTMLAGEHLQYWDERGWMVIDANGGIKTVQVSVNGTEANLSLSDVTTDDVSISRHGFAPKAPNDVSKFLDGTGAWSSPGGNTVPLVVEAGQSVTANDFVTLLPDGTIRKAASDITITANPIGGTDVVTSNPVLIGKSIAGATLLSEFDSTHVLYRAQDITNGDLTACSFFVATPTTVGARATVTVPASTAISNVLILSSTSFLVVFTGNSQAIQVAVGSVSGTTITFGTTTSTGVNVTSGAVTTLVLSASQVLMVYNTLSLVTFSISGTTVTVGTSTSIPNGSSQAFTVLDSQNVIATFNNANSQALVINVASNTITLGAANVLSLSTGALANVQVYDATHFAAVYRDSTNANKLTACAMSVSGTTITAGTPVVISNTTTNPTAFVLGGSSAGNTAWNSTTSVFIGPDSTLGSRTSVIAFTVSGTTVTAGSTITLDSQFKNNGSLTTAPNPAFMYKIDDTSGLVFFSQVSNFGSFAVPFTLSGGTVTIGTAWQTLASTSGSDVIINASLPANLGSGKVAILMGVESGALSQQTVILIGVSANVATELSSASIETGSASSVSGVLYQVDSTHLVLWCINPSRRQAAFYPILVSGNSLIVGRPALFNSESSPGGPSISSPLNSTGIRWQAQPTGTLAFCSMWAAYDPTLAGVPLGIALQSGGAGATVTVQYGGIVPGFTSLTVGAPVYVNETGDVTQSSLTGYMVGRAISSTQIALSVPSVTL